VSGGAEVGFVPRSLVLATDLDVLPPGRIVERRDGYAVVRSPQNPEFYWGNLLVFGDPPATGDGARWEALFRREFAAEERVRHRTFAWDRSDGALGQAAEEFVARGYDLEQSVGLVATAASIRPHARENTEVTVHTLDPAVGADEQLWHDVVELQVASRDGRSSEQEARAFSRRRLADRRALFRTGRGAWYAARLDGQVVGSCGVVVTAGRGRFQVVDTAEQYRRRGICSRLVVEAARRSTAGYGAERFVIVADAGYHALGLYESLGFEPAERVAGVCRWPTPR
jgi:ribosomal protein S18 acetylase RimI-like enzyme